MKNSYFTFFSNCFLVQGATRSIICDTQKTRFDFVPNSLVQIVEELKDRTIDDVRSHLAEDDQRILNEYIQFLIENEFGTMCSPDEKDCFIDPFKDALAMPPEITNCIVDVDINSRHNFKKIVMELDELQCMHLQVRCYNQLNSLSLLRTILECSNGTSLLSVEFLFKYTEDCRETDIISIIREFPRLHQVVVHSAPYQKVENLTGGSSLIFVTDQIDSDAHCGIISPYYFSINVSAIQLAQTMNSCLAGKISIDVVGNIKNCPSTKGTFGNSQDVSLRQALAIADFNTLWFVKKDQISVCKDCEFRYICSDCRAFLTNPDDRYSKPLKCGYDPYLAEWR